MRSTGRSNVFPLVIVSFVILLLVGGVYWFGKNSIIRNNSDKVSEIKEEDKTKESSESTLDEKSNTEIKESDTSPVEKVVDKESDEDVIETLKLLFAQKYQKKVEDIVVTISKREGDYLIGGIRFSNEMGGGIVLAAKANGVWKIVFDGNGLYTCNVVDAVDFPSSLAPQCWDENTSGLVDRAAR